MVHVRVVCDATDTRLFQRTAKMAVMFLFNQREPRHARAPKPIVSYNVVVGWRCNEFITHSFTHYNVELPVNKKIMNFSYS